MQNRKTVCHMYPKGKRMGHTRTLSICRSVPIRSHSTLSHVTTPVVTRTQCARPQSTHTSRQLTEQSVRTSPPSQLFWLSLRQPGVRQRARPPCCTRRCLGLATTPHGVQHARDTPHGRPAAPHWPQPRRQPTPDTQEVKCELYSHSVSSVWSHPPGTGTAD